MANSSIHSEMCALPVTCVCLCCDHDHKTLYSTTHTHIMHMCEHLYSIEAQTCSHYPHLPLPAHTLHSFHTPPPLSQHTFTPHNTHTHQSVDIENSQRNDSLYHYSRLRYIWHCLSWHCHSRSDSGHKIRSR